MKKIIQSRFIWCLIVFFTMTLIVQAPIQVKAKTCDDLTYVALGDYYQISTGADLEIMACHVNSGASEYIDASYHLKNDIDLAGVNWIPIGTSLNPFAGLFDGSGFTISNLSITSLVNAYKVVDGAQLYETGFFGTLSGANISDLTLDEFSITVVSNTVLSDTEASVRQSRIGILAATVKDSTLIDQINITNASITINNPSTEADGLSNTVMTVVGGLISQVEADTIISEVKVEVDVNILSNWEDSSSFIVGGVMGYAKDSQLSKAIVTGSFIVNDLQTGYSSTFLGGLIGYSEKMDVTDSSVTADITVQPYMGDNIVGGAIGFSGGTSSYNQISYKGIISTSGFTAGGLMGAAFTDSESLDLTSITESYVEADVSALLSAGGILGIAAGSLEISDSSYDGALTDSLSKGGIVGMIMDANTIISRCFSLGTIQFYLPNGSAFGSGGIYGTNNAEVTLTDVYSRMDFSFENPNKVGLMDAGDIPWVGGISGLNSENDQFSNVYYAGHIILGESNAYNDPLVYYDPDSSPLLAQNLYFDHDLSPLDSLYGSPKTTTEMKLESTFVGFDFEEVWIILPYINDGYPTFKKSLDEVTYLDGTDTSKVYVKRGSSLEKSDDPIKTDYIFGGWYIDETYTTLWNFETGLVQSDITLYAKWTAKITDTDGSNSMAGLLLVMGSVLLIGSRKRKVQSC